MPGVAGGHFFAIQLDESDVQQRVHEGVRVRLTMLVGEERRGFADEATRWAVNLDLLDYEACTVGVRGVRDRGGKG